MPNEICGTLFELEDLTKVISLVKEFYVGKPQSVPDATKTAASPFTALKAEYHRLDDSSLQEDQYYRFGCQARPYHPYKPYVTRVKRKR